MGTFCCLCGKNMPKRKKKFHGSSCMAAKSALTVLSTVPLESIATLGDDPDSVLCSDCELPINNISHYQSKVDCLKKRVAEMLSSVIPTITRERPSVTPCDDRPQQPCLANPISHVEDLAMTQESQESPDVKVSQ